MYLRQFACSMPKEDQQFRKLNRALQLLAVASAQGAGELGPGSTTERSGAHSFPEAGTPIFWRSITFACARRCAL